MRETGCLGLDSDGLFALGCGLLHMTEESVILLVTAHSPQPLASRDQ